MTETSEVTMVTILRRNLEPTLEMLSLAIEICPDEVWDVADGNAPVWQHAYHSLFWLNAWLRDWDQELERPPFHSGEALDLVPGAIPVITKQQMVAYQAKVYADCESLLDGTTPERLTQEREAFGVSGMLADRILGQARHVQHHAGMMHAIISRRAGRDVEWRGFNE